MIPTAFDYQRASSIDDAIQKLQRGGKLLAGGHSIVPLMKLRLSEPGSLVDIGRIKDLAGVGERDGKITIGAATVHHEVATSSVIQQKCPMVSEAAAEIGDPQVRNRGTLGGSLAHADPSADYPAVLLALDAELHMKGPKGWRVVKASEFFRGLFTVNLAADEVIASAQFVPVKTAAYAKLHQRASHYAIVGVAAALDIKGGTIQSARVGLTGATTHAIRLTNVEQALAGKPATKESIEAAARLAGAGLTDVSADIHASEEYRRAMVPVFARRALERALARA
jgi:aerobic carbon-monoxide dehydrogenase medium subunit